MFFHYANVENQNLNNKCNELIDMVKTLQVEVCELNNIITANYDTSGSNMTCVSVDACGNFIPCLHKDMSGNIIPCVLPPFDLSGGASRCFPYYPYYPYGGYPYGYYPYGGLLGSNDDYYNRDFVVPEKHVDQPHSHPHVSHPANQTKRCWGEWGRYGGWGYGYPYGDYPYGDYPYYPGHYRDMSSGMVPNKKVVLPANPTHIHIYPNGNIVPPSPIHNLPVSTTTVITHH